MKNIKHIDKTYAVKKIDMLGREVFASDGTVIKFDYFGTGQSQSAYLRGLLSRADKRKLVVLFDEISNMDTDSLEPIREKISELYSKGSLVMAMLVQKGDQTRVHSLVD
jgi:nucleoside-triphosphatase THEP1